ncbi:MAG: bifunctional DNA-formamidopyrimidine glycosylase/DNA-(apurinic or apyrimidinic site) lyase [Candidatus Taylorbacteria bacterium]
MPELPEVQTTVNGLRDHIVGLTVKDAWSNYDSPYYKGSETIKDPLFFKYFRSTVHGKKVISVERRAKNILINVTGGKTILVHMKMTGHLLYGLYKFNKSETAEIKRDPWEPISPSGLKDPYNRRVRFVITFTNGKHMALSDTRRFAKVTLVDTRTVHESEHLIGVGPEPLDDAFTFFKFNERIDLRPTGKIKLVLLDQNIIAGIGNIYADESLWRAGIHPLRTVNSLTSTERKLVFRAIKHTLSHGIDFGGDSMSDYRNVMGERGKFQDEHMAYQRTGEKCGKPRCSGTIIRIVVGGRGTHLCDTHQINPAS